MLLRVMILGGIPLVAKLHLAMPLSSQLSCSLPAADCLSAPRSAKYNFAHKPVAECNFATRTGPNNLAT